MKLGRLNHIGVATPSIAESIAHYRDTLGVTAISDPFDMAEQGVKVCFVDTPGENGTHGTQIELIEPLGPDSPIAKFIQQNPAGAQHHVCYEAHGTPIFFLHPKDMMGQLTEIMETPRGDSHWSN